jgi:hypothetical protein
MPDTPPGSAAHTFEDYNDPRFDHEAHHRDALARELTYAADVPLRDRYGFAASGFTVARVVEIVASEPDDAKASEGIGLANALGDIQLADGYDTPIDEDYERAIVAALRPLVEQRRAAGVRSLRDR